MRFAVACVFVGLVVAGCRQTPPAGTPVIALPDGRPGIGFDDLQFSKTYGVLAPGGRSGYLDLVDPVTRAVTGQRFTGVIKRVAHAIDGKTRTMPVELDVENVNGKLAPGMFADVFWPVRRDAPSLFVPSSAVVQTTERTYVDRVRDGVIEQVTVQRGTALKDRVEVFGQLQPGDAILKRGSEELKDGAKVKTKPFVPDGGAK